MLEMLMVFCLIQIIFIILQESLKKYKTYALYSFYKKRELFRKRAAELKIYKKDFKILKRNIKNS